MSQIVFWQNSIKGHQNPLLAALAALGAEAGFDEVRVHCEAVIAPERSTHGWSRRSPETVTVRSLEQGSSVGDLTRETFGRGSVHVFWGFHMVKPFVPALLSALARRERAYVLCERPTPTPYNAILAPLIYRLYARTLMRRLEGVLCLGDLGLSYFEGCGFDAGRLFPWGYIGAVDALPSVGDADPVYDILFVGSGLKRKGFDVLCAALTHLETSVDWRLHVVTGDRPDTYRELISSSGIAGKASVIGALPNAQVLALMSRADLLVLPSRFDGWGTVISEALLAGTPVVASDRCGAACLISRPEFGHVVRAGDADDLRRAIEAAIGGGGVDRTLRSDIRRTAAAMIGPEAMAEYLLSLFARGRGGRSVAPPWRSVAGA